MDGRGWPAYAWSFDAGDGTANVGFGMLLPRLRATGPGRPGRAARAAASSCCPATEAERLVSHHLPLSTVAPAAAARPGAAGGRRRLARQPADRRGHLLRAAVRPARRASPP